MITLLVATKHYGDSKVGKGKLIDYSVLQSIRLE